MEALEAAEVLGRMRWGILLRSVGDGEALEIMTASDLNAVEEKYRLGRREAFRCC